MFSGWVKLWLLLGLDTGFCACGGTRDSELISKSRVECSTQEVVSIGDGKTATLQGRTQGESSGDRWIRMSCGIWPYGCSISAQSLSSFIAKSLRTSCSRRWKTSRFASEQTIFLWFCSSPSTPAQRDLSQGISETKTSELLWYLKHTHNNRAIWEQFLFWLWKDFYSCKSVSNPILSVLLCWPGQ